MNRTDWFENRFIRDMFLDTSFVDRYERLLEKANIDTIKNSINIFNNLKGSALEYDLEVFDVFAEVRLICWARENDYTNIEKLVPSSRRTPDFLMEKTGVKTIAEAKHFRAREYLLDFVYDRVGGLLVKTGLYHKIGIVIEATEKYGKYREALVKQSAEIRADYIRRAREEIPDNLLEKIMNEGDTQIKILNGLINIKITSNIGLLGVQSGGSRNRLNSSELMIDKLEGNLKNALSQIAEYIRTQHLKTTNLNALVFLSGTGPEEEEWDIMWDMLCKFRDNSVVERVFKLREEAQKLVDIPFELIVGMGIPLRYDYFPWTGK